MLGKGLITLRGTEVCVQLGALSKKQKHCGLILGDAFGQEKTEVPCQ